jgi:hypothetical protein
MSKGSKVTAKVTAKVGALRAVVMEAEKGPSPYTQVRMLRRVAQVFHQIVKADGLSISDTLERMIIAYVEKHHPDWELCFDEDEG